MFEGKTKQVEEELGIKAETPLTLRSAVSHQFDEIATPLNRSTSSAVESQLSLYNQVAWSGLGSLYNAVASAAGKGCDGVGRAGTTKYTYTRELTEYGKCRSRQAGVAIKRQKHRVST